MSSTRALLPSLIAVSLLYGHDATAQDQYAALLSAERLIAELSRDSGLTTALVRNLHPTATLLWPGAPVVIGKDKIRTLLGVIDSDARFLTWQALHVEFARDSSLAATWGLAIAGSRQDARSVEMGRYVAVWLRDRAQWSIAALVFSGLAGSQAATWPRDLALAQPPLNRGGPAGAFVDADLAFARMAGTDGAGPAFSRWAAPEAMMFGGQGLLVRGPEAIGRALAGPADWRWYPVAAGAARSGDIGWTAGQAVIAAQGAEATHSKYLTVWRRLPGGTVRFLTDGGNARPASPD